MTAIDYLSLARGALEAAEFHSEHDRRESAKGETQKAIACALIALVERVDKIIAQQEAGLQELYKP